MKTTKKRIISLFLSVLMIVSIIPIGTISASATNGLPNYGDVVGTATKEDTTTDGNCVISAEEIEENNSVSKSNIISVNKTYSGSISNADSWVGLTDIDLDYYKFTLNEDGYIYIDFSHKQLDNGHWIMNLLDKDGYNFLGEYKNEWEIQGRLSDTFTSRKIGLPKGTYVLKIKGYDDVENVNYKFQVGFIKTDNWESEANNKITTADIMSTNKTYYGNISRSNNWIGLADIDLDYYKFTLNEDEYIYIEFSHKQLDGGRWIMSLLDKDGYNFLDEYKNEWEIQGEKSDAYTTEKIMLPKGTYIIEIKGYDDVENVDYSFKVNCQSLPDINADSKISIVDAKWILQNIANLRDLNDTQKTAADLNKDGKVTIIDAKWVLQIVAGLRDEATLE